MRQYLWVSLACGMFLGACGAELSEDAKGAPLPPSAKGTAASTNQLFDSQPQVSIINGDQAATINISLPENIDKLHPDLAKELRERANASTEQFIASAEADRESAKQEGFDFHPHSLDVSWIEIGPSGGRLTGYLGTYATYTGGAHPNVGFDVLNWDRQSNRLIGFDDLFRNADTARAVIAMELRAGILRAKRERLEGMEINEDEIIEAWIGPAFDSTNTILQAFTIARSSDETLAGGLIYHFAPYEIGAYAEGVYEVGVSYEAFKDELKPGLSGAFGGTPILP